MPRHDVSTPRGEKCLQYLSRRLGLGAMMTILGAFTLAGCYISRTIDQATASDVNNRSFTFADGAVFHAALANVSTILAFTNNATSFTLTSAGGMATGTNRFGSCILTVTNMDIGSNTPYPSGQGPQVGDVITLDPCDFDRDNSTLTVSNRGITATSTVATASGTGNQATAIEVNNHSFAFTRLPAGGVFHTALTNVSTTLAFTNNATNFTLTSASGTATGTNRFGSCILTVTNTGNNTPYPSGQGPQTNDVITLNPCNFDITHSTLTVSNGTITATSAAGTVIVP